MSHCSCVDVSRRAVACFAALIGLCAPSPAWSQTTAGSAWRQGAVLAGGVGGVSDSSGTAVAVAASVAWEIVPQFSVESRAAWLGDGAGASGFGAVFGVRTSLPPRRVVPFLSMSAGVYRAVFDGSAPLPTCYRGRAASAGAGLGVRHVFNDLAYAAGIGADLFLGRRVALRPEASVLLVRVDGRTHPIWVVGAQLAYHFASHPVSPQVRSGRAAR
jgi:hypothetical protein